MDARKADFGKGDSRGQLLRQLRRLVGDSQELRAESQEPEKAGSQLSTLDFPAAPPPSIGCCLAGGCGAGCWLSGWEERVE